MSRNRAVIAWLIVAAGSVLLVAWIARMAVSPTLSAGPSQAAAVTKSAAPALAPSPSPSPSPAFSPTPSASPARHPRRRQGKPPAVVPVVPVVTDPATDPATDSAPPTAPACYPRNHEGHCYEPGDFCWPSEQGATGVAGDGQRIRCELHYGWRWEPI